MSKNRPMAASKMPSSFTSGKPHPLRWPLGWGKTFRNAGVSGKLAEDPSASQILYP